MSFIGELLLSTAMLVCYAAAEEGSTLPEVKDADVENVEFIPVDERACPVNPKALQPAYPQTYLLDPDYSKKIVKVTMLIYIGNDDRIKNIIDVSAPEVPEEFKERAIEAVKNLQWCAAKVKKQSVGSWIAFDVRFKQPVVNDDPGLRK